MQASSIICISCSTATAEVTRVEKLHSTKAVEEALERQVNKWKAHDQDYLDAVAAGDIEKTRGLENMLRLCARDPIFEAIVYVFCHNFTINNEPKDSA